MKHNCVSLCNIVKEQILKTRFINERYSDKHMAVFHHSLWLEKITTNKTHVPKYRYAKHSLGYHDFVYL